MATILLQNAGMALGSAFGPLGAMLGRAAGAYAGSLVDRRIFGEEQVVTAPRLEQARIMASADGAPMPRIYGRVRIGGQLVWATRFEEVTTRNTQGGKGGPAVTVEDRAYFANFAVGLCEGEISCVRRIWADGRELDRTRHEIRIYLGTEDQAADPLIEAKQGVGNVPGFRGTAYAVFERFALSDFGNRIPQLSFEIIRSVSRLDASIEAVTIMPGATESGYSPVPEANVSGPSTGGPRNRNNSTHETDWAASIDELTVLCPNLKRVALVIAWFGDDLRAGACEIRPRVEYRDAGGKWNVAGVGRSQALEASRHEGRPAHGGTPSDHCVIAAIADLKSRGLEVHVYPFLMMDIPHDNGLPDPYGEAEQAAYPWRGRVTCDPAGGKPDSADGTAAARQQFEQFAGQCAVADFSVSNGEIHYDGPAEWSYRRMVLHCAGLAAAAGGVSGFLIGSEMAAATVVRDDSGAFPFVGMLQALAADARILLGPDALITYAADWSEYFGHQPQGTTDRFFHLDPLWADAEIDAVAIDNYMPLSDWRVGGDPVDTTVASQSAPDYLDANIEGGEGHDWYYASEPDRLAGLRTPITDGLGEPWIWRFKDIRSWWQSPHHERVDGVRSQVPTAWVPASKPVMFTELGCGAVTMGANQPNRFPDAKSAENGLPHFSSGARSDLVQQRFLLAHFAHWSDPANNPQSPVYGGPMIDTGRMFAWAWDARPFPEFPANSELWSDGKNWHTGHWLNGRIGGCPLDDLLAAVASDFGIEIETRCDGFVDGYLIADPSSPRQALQPLAELFSTIMVETDGVARLIGPGYADHATIASADLVAGEEFPLIVRSRDRVISLPAEAGLSHAGIFSGYESEHSYSRRLETGHGSQEISAVPAVMPRSTATGALEAGLREAWIGRERAAISLPHRYMHLVPGDIVTFEGEKLPGSWRIESIEDGDFRRLKLRAAGRFEMLPGGTSTGGDAGSAPQIYGAPQCLIMNLPLAPADDMHKVHIALTAEPWARRYAVWSSPGMDGFQYRRTIFSQASAGRLLAPLAPGPEGRWDRANTLAIELDHGEFESLPDDQVLNGANAVAVLADNGEWEILQFAAAQMQGDGTWILSRLLRAQLGTDPAMLSGAPQDAPIVLLDTGVERIDLTDLEASLELNWRVGPAADPVSADSYVQQTLRHSALDRRPFSPVHVTARRTPGGDLDIRWIRRTRIDGDSWEAAEPPLGETSERYLLSILAADGSLARAIETPEPSAIYTAADQLADFGEMSAGLRISVAQLSSVGLAGAVRTETLASGISTP